MAAPMPDTLDEVHQRVFERALEMTDARLVSMLLVVNKHARQLAGEVADECYGGDRTRSKPRQHS